MAAIELDAYSPTWNSIIGTDPSPTSICRLLPRSHRPADCPDGQSPIFRRRFHELARLGVCAGKTLVVYGCLVLFGTMVCHGNKKGVHSKTTIIPKMTIFIWLVVSTPLKNISQVGWLFAIYGGFLKHPFIDRIFPWKPTSYWGTSMTNWKPSYIYHFFGLPLIAGPIDWPNHQAPNQHRLTIGDGCHAVGVAAVTKTCSATNGFLSIYLSIYLFVYLSIYLSIYIYIHIYICIYICIYRYMYVYIYVCHI